MRPPITSSLRSIASDWQYINWALYSSVLVLPADTGYTGMYQRGHFRTTLLHCDIQKEKVLKKKQFFVVFLFLN